MRLVKNYKGGYIKKESTALFFFFLISNQNVKIIQWFKRSEVSFSVKTQHMKQNSSFLQISANRMTSHLKPHTFPKKKTKTKTVGIKVVS